MRRAVPVIAATVGGLALVANFHTKPAGVPLAAGLGSTQPTAPRSPGATTPATLASPGTTSPGATSPATAAPSGTRSVDGPVITTDYGDVQVRVTLNGKQIVDVQALQLPQDRSRSVRISQYSGPQLRSEALQAQSANINLVSGATYTSQGYIESLQGAIDAASR
jgi:uncharacterized protein with FMN-binding domain